MDNYATLFSLVVIVVAFYLLLVRPQQKQQKEHRALVESLVAGDEIVTIGGIYGTVRVVGDERISVEVAPSVTMDFLPQAVARRVTPAVPKEQ